MTKYIYLLATLAFIVTSCQNEEKVIPSPEIYLQIPEGGFDFDTDSAEIIEPKITYDINSVYAWFEDGVQFHDEKDLTIEKLPLGTYKYQFTVLTDYGDDTMNITVHSLHINTFEEFNSFNDDGYFNNPAEGYHEFKGYVQYPCLFNEATPDDWSGFAISENASTSSSSADNEFSVYGKSAADESDNFTIFKQMEGIPNNIKFDDEGKAHVVKSIAVNNCTNSYLYMLSNFNKKEGKDYFLLSISGLDEAGAVISGPIEHLLADYRPEATAYKYIQSEWEQIDLKELGAVHQLAFQLTSSRDDEADFELPMYFCLDNLQIIE
ncbi:DUF4465 domain-containing protein [Carboxylicivirga sp. A043]|uniref:DUF4465 domain-containing protein n=1 Tax=Carboxylicivirga litoralis TaxID=2816963 RepID=UPI0021CB0076|nr:DUF4465 domain-containing protein [Carboxylicivirga sp. A043]MCU4157680.1 DUF4465 domain-containing protein [Carboxylicivirga sp. A043]